MIKRELYTRNFPGGSSQESGVYLPLRGPFVIIGQFSVFLCTKWSDAKSIAEVAGKLSDTLDIQRGQIAYQEGPQDSVEVAAYHYCTSD